MVFQCHMETAVAPSRPEAATATAKTALLRLSAPLVHRTPDVLRFSSRRSLCRRPRTRLDARTRRRKSVRSFQSLQPQRHLNGFLSRSSGQGNTACTSSVGLFPCSSRTTDSSVEWKRFDTLKDFTARPRETARRHRLYDAQVGVERDNYIWERSSRLGAVPIVFGRSSSLARSHHVFCLLQCPAPSYFARAARSDK